MRKDNYKPCNRTKCPYYGFKSCPKKDVCDYSTEAAWHKNRKTFWKPGISTQIVINSLEKIKKTGDKHE